MVLARSEAHGLRPDESKSFEQGAAAAQPHVLGHAFWHAGSNRPLIPNADERVQLPRTLMCRGGEGREAES